MKRMTLALVGLALIGGASWLLAAEASPPKPPWFKLRAVYADGTVMEGYDLDAEIAFEPTIACGETVKVQFGQPPHWYTAPYSGSVTWDTDRKLYIFRSPQWTAEFTALWDTLALTAADGQAIPMPGKDLRELTIEFARPPQPTK